MRSFIFFLCRQHDTRFRTFSRDWNRTPNTESHINSVHSNGPLDLITVPGSHSMMSVIALSLYYIGLECPNKFIQINQYIILCLALITNISLSEPPQVCRSKDCTQRHQTKAVVCYSFFPLYLHHELIVGTNCKLKENRSMWNRRACIKTTKVSFKNPPGDTWNPSPCSDLTADFSTCGLHEPRDNISSPPWTQL